MSSASALIETAALLEERLAKVEFYLRDPRAEDAKTEASKTQDSAAQDTKSQDTTSQESPAEAAAASTGTGNVRGTGPGPESQTILERVAKVEQNFAELCKSSETIRDLLSLYERAERILGPLNLHSNNSNTADATYVATDTETQRDRDGEGRATSSGAESGAGGAGKQPLTAEEKLTMILASESSLRAAASQLGALREMQFPDTQALAELLALRPRLEHAQRVQAEHARAVEQLRARTAAVLARYYETEILETGARWAGFEDRLARLELARKRREATQLREQNEL